MQSKKTLFSTRDLVIVGLFSALAYVLMLLESPGYLGFLRIEFSDVPAILGGLGLGPDFFRKLTACGKLLSLVLRRSMC